MHAGPTLSSLSPSTSTELPAIPFKSCLIGSVNCPEAEVRKEITVEFESLSPPCRLEFSCKLLTRYTTPHTDSGSETHSDVHAGKADGSTEKRARLDDSGESVPMSKKRSRKTKGGRVRHESGTKSRGLAKKEGNDAESAGGGSEWCLFLEFEWITGDNRDILHQVVQYFKNKFQSLKF